MMSTNIARPLNSWEFVKSHGNNATFTDSEYRALAETAVEEVRDLCTNIGLWESLGVKDGIQLFERASDLKDANENMLLSIVTIPCSIKKLEKLVSPWYEYRVNWDDMLDSATVLRDFGDEIYLTRQLVKKLYIISARESIDIVKVARRPNEVVFGSTGVTHANYPPVKSYIRTHLYIGGYLLRPDSINSDHTQFYMVFHADLHMPRLVAPLLAKFKPKLMCQKIENLKKAVDKYKDI